VGANAMEEIYAFDSRYIAGSGKAAVVVTLAGPAHLVEELGDALLAAAPSKT
jgi:hypothetical protein